MKFSLAASVYFVWQERNLRIFKNEERDSSVLIKIIYDEIRAKLMSLKTKKSNAVNAAAMSLEVQFD